MILVASVQLLSLNRVYEFGLIYQRPKSSGQVKFCITAKSLGIDVARVIEFESLNEMESMLFFVQSVLYTKGETIRSAQLDFKQFTSYKFTKLIRAIDS